VKRWWSLGATVRKADDTTSSKGDENFLRSSVVSNKAITTGQHSPTTICYVFPSFSPRGMNSTTGSITFRYQKVVATIFRTEGVSPLVRQSYRGIPPLRSRNSRAARTRFRCHFRYPPRKLLPVYQHFQHDFAKKSSISKSSLPSSSVKRGPAQTVFQFSSSRPFRDMPTTSFPYVSTSFRWILTKWCCKGCDNRTWPKWPLVRIVTIPYIRMYIYIVSINLINNQRNYWRTFRVCDARVYITPKPEDRLLVYTSKSYCTQY